MATKLFKINPNSEYTHMHEGKRHGYDCVVCRTDAEIERAEEAGYKPNLTSVIKAGLKVVGDESPKPKRGPKPKQAAAQDDDA